MGDIKTDNNAEKSMKICNVVLSYHAHNHSQ